MKYEIKEWYLMVVTYYKMPPPAIFNGFRETQQEITVYHYMWLFPEIVVPLNGWSIMENPF